jgi:hypothetical protein
MDGVAVDGGHLVMAFPAARLQDALLGVRVIGLPVAVNLPGGVTIQAFHTLVEMDVDKLVVLLSRLYVAYTVAFDAGLLAASLLGGIDLEAVDRFGVAGVAALDVAVQAIQLSNGDPAQLLNSSLLLAIPESNPPAGVMEAVVKEVLLRPLALLGKAADRE